MFQINGMTVRWLLLLVVIQADIFFSAIFKTQLPSYVYESLYLRSWKEDTSRRKCCGGFMVQARKEATNLT